VNGAAVDPFISDGTTYLPVRAVSVALGKKVDWDAETKTVYITDGASGETAGPAAPPPAERFVGVKTLAASFDDIKINVNGKEISPKDAAGDAVPPFISSGTTYLPVRAVAEAFGLPVSWDGASKSVYVGKRPEGAAAGNIPADSNVAGDNSDEEAPIIENALFIGTAANEHVGDHFYIGNSDTQLPRQYKEKVFMGNRWDNTPEWKSDLEYWLTRLKIEKNGAQVTYADLPDYSDAGTEDNRKQHFLFSLDLTEGQEQEHNSDPGTQKDFFGIIPDEFIYGNLGPGILHTWSWDSVDVRNELGEILIKKGYRLAYESPQSATAITKHRTVVEMNTMDRLPTDSPREYLVSYFDGNGNYWVKRYSE
jgi:hypothetical protein